MDAGNLYWRSARLTAQERPQQVEKAKLMAAAVHLGGIDAMLLAEGDLALGLDFVRSLANEHELPYLATNLDCGDGFPASQQVIARAGMTIGVLGVVNDKLEWPGCTVSDPRAALTAGLGRLRGKVDVVVLLDALSDEMSEGLNRAVPGVDLVIGGTSQPLQSPGVVPGGGLQLGPGGRGRNVGVLTFTLVDGATGWREDSTIGRLAGQRDRFREKVEEARAAVEAANGESARLVAQKRTDYYQKQVDEVEAQLVSATAASGRTHTAHNTLVTLDTAVADDPAVLALVAEAKGRIAAAAGSPPASPHDALPGPAAGPYIGSAACSGCHAAASAQWQTTAHANAYAALQGVHRELDQECFGCHVTGAVAGAAPDSARGLSILGPTRPTDVAGLTNVGCESCHGPGRQHAANPTGGPAPSIPTQATCVACHNAAQDDGRFDFASYLPRIVHNGSIAVPAHPRPAGAGMPW